VFDEPTGNRVHHSPDLVGTAKRSFGKKELDFMLEKLDTIENEMKDLREVMRTHDVITRRFKKHGNINKKMAKDLGLVGPTARASGINYDVRKNAPYMAYAIKELTVKPVVRDTGDSYTRSMNRLDEIFESMRLLRKAAEMIDPKEAVPKKPPFFVKEGFGMGRSEAPRGENFHFINVENNRIVRMKLRTPTLANVISYSQILEGEDITDVPVIIGSLDPCISCMERVAVIKDKKEEVWNSHELFAGKKHD